MFKCEINIFEGRIKYTYRATFPDSLKNAVVIPVFKKGDTNDVGNYRFISLLTSFSKKKKLRR